jgi:hypothetical protein
MPRPGEKTKVAERRGARATFEHRNLCASVNPVMTMAVHAVMMTPARMLRGPLDMAAIEGCGRRGPGPCARHQKQCREPKQKQTFHADSVIC